MKEVSEMKKDFSDLKEAIKSNQGKAIRPDDSNVVIAQMKLDALLQMSDDEKDIFSQVKENEVNNIARALVFSRDCLPSITERLKSRGIDKTFTLHVLEKYIFENFRHLQKADRKRVQEFLTGLKSITQTNSYNEEVVQKSLLKRLV